jgi:hypothetical protein
MKNVIAAARLFDLPALATSAALHIYSFYLNICAKPGKSKKVKDGAAGRCLSKMCE